MPQRALVGNAERAVIAAWRDAGQDRCGVPAKTAVRRSSLVSEQAILDDALPGSESGALFLQPLYLLPQRRYLVVGALQQLYRVGYVETPVLVGASLLDVLLRVAHSPRPAISAARANSVSEGVPASFMQRATSLIVAATVGQ